MFVVLPTKGSSTSKQKPATKKKVFQTGCTADRDFGSWEKYSSGFGSKMLAKMGWAKGMGLGVKGEGIVNPVKATKHTEFGKGLAHMQVSKVQTLIVLLELPQLVCCGVGTEWTFMTNCSPLWLCIVCMYKVTCSF